MGRGAHLQDKKMAEIVNLSAETIIKALSSSILSEEFRAELASKFVVKAMPVVLDGNGIKKQLIYVITDREYKTRGENLLEVQSSQITAEDSQS